MARAWRPTAGAGLPRTLGPAKPPRRQPSRKPPVANPMHTPTASPRLTSRVDSASKRLVAWREECRLWNLPHSARAGSVSAPNVCLASPVESPPTPRRRSAAVRRFVGLEVQAGAHTKPARRSGASREARIQAAAGAADAGYRDCSCRGAEREAQCLACKCTLACLPRALMPNPSLKRSANGMSRWPSSAGPAAHFALAVQRAMPSSPA